MPPPMSTTQAERAKISYDTVKCYQQAKQILASVESHLSQAETAIAFQSEAVAEAQVALSRTKTADMPQHGDDQPEDGSGSEASEDEYTVPPAEQARTLVLQAERATTTNLVEAEVLLKDAVSLFAEAELTDTMEGAQAAWRYGRIHVALGRFKEAAPLMAQALEVYERELGMGDPQSLELMAAIVLLAVEQGEEISGEEKMVHHSEQNLSEFKAELREVCGRADSFLEYAKGYNLLEKGASSATKLALRLAQAYKTLGDVLAIDELAVLVEELLCDSEGRCLDDDAAREMGKWVEQLKALASWLQHRIAVQAALQEEKAAEAAAEAAAEPAASASDAPAAPVPAPAPAPAPAGSAEEGDEEGTPPPLDLGELQRKQLDMALRLSKKVVEHFRTTWTSTTLGYDLALFSCALASLHLMEGNSSEAHDLLDANVPHLQKHLGIFHPTVSYTLADYGEACLAVNRFNVAKRAFKKALEGTNKNPEHFSDDFIQRIANGSTL